MDWRTDLWRRAGRSFVRQPNPLMSPEGRFDCLLFSADSRFLITSAPATSGAIRTVDVMTSEPVGTLDEPGELLRLTADGRLQFIADHRFFRCSIPELAPLESVALRGASHATPLAFSDDGSKLLMKVSSGRSPDSLLIYNLLSHALTLVGTCDSEPVGGVLTAGDRFLVTIHRNSSSVQLRPQSSLDELRLLSGHRKEVTAIGLTPDDALVITGSNDGSLCIWETCSWHRAVTISLPDTEIISLAISPNGRFLGVGVNSPEFHGAFIWELRKLIVATRSGTVPHENVSNALALLREEQGLDGLVWLLRSPQEGLDALHAEMAPSLGAWTAEHVRKRISELDHPDFHVRSQAFKELHARRGMLQKYLTAAIDPRPRLEGRLSIARLLADDSGQIDIDTAEIRRMQRVVFFLAGVDDPRATELLNLLSEAHASPYVQIIARRALQASGQRASLRNTGPGNGL
jgi:WD40 repeat protein